MIAVDGKILRALEAVEPVDALDVVVVFGSRARGEPRADSDLDVAILPATHFAGERWRLQGEVAALLAELAPGGRVDVVFLDEAPELLRQRIMETGRPILLRDPKRWRDLRVLTMREHGDREPYRRLLRTAQMRRLLGRGQGDG